MPMEPRNPLSLSAAVPWRGPRMDNHFYSKTTANLSSAAQTGEISFSGSYDGEDRSLLNNGGAGGARVAESKPLFACVADSITTAASSFSTAMQTQTLTHDDEGNVHGVDGSSLLVVSQAGRNQNQG